MNRSACSVLAVFSLPLVLNSSARSAEPPLTTVVVASGLTRPTYITHARGDTTRLWITEQTGAVKLMKNGAVLATPFLSATVVPGFTGANGLEYGLLSICFHPNYAQNGYFFVCLTVDGPRSPVLMRFRRMANDPDRADPASGIKILQIDYTSLPNHRSAWMDFGPDGYLYYNTGDGAEQDPTDQASNKNTLRGKILRLDVNGPDGEPGTADDDGFPADALKHYHVPPTNPFVGLANHQPEIWAYGLRNPWRACFDRLTHDLYIGDVGQFTREEISFIPAGSPGGVFFGWHCKEGTVATGYSGCPATLPASSPPIFEYRGVNANIISGNSVIGGYVYRGCAIPELGGTYIFGDWNGQVASLRRSELTGEFIAQNRTATIGIAGTISSFGEDALGEIYICDWSTTAGAGAIHKIVPTTPQGPDCNTNGRRDACDIAALTSPHANTTGVPEECECATCNGDTTGDNMIDSLDIQRFASCAGAANLNGPGCRCANMNADSGVNIADVPLFIDKLLGTTDPDPACP